MPATSPACTGSPEPHAEQLTLHHAARLRAGQSGEGHFEQLWNQLGALRESKIARSETIESKSLSSDSPCSPRPHAKQQTLHHSASLQAWGAARISNSRFDKTHCRIPVYQF